MSVHDFLVHGVAIAIVGLNTKAVFLTQLYHLLGALIVKRGHRPNHGLPRGQTEQPLASIVRQSESQRVTESERQS